MRTPLPLLAMLLAAAMPAAADLVVVVNARSPAAQLSRDEVINIFLGRYRDLPGGKRAVPLDLPLTDPDRAKFYRLLVGKELAQINAYWSRLVFSGKTTPPLQTGGAGDTLRALAENSVAVGYLDRSRIDGNVRIVLELE